jgi:hypothetical protein
MSDDDDDDEDEDDERERKERVVVNDLTFFQENYFLKKRINFILHKKDSTMH